MTIVPMTAPRRASPPGAVERALAAAIRDASRTGDLLDELEPRPAVAAVAGRRRPGHRRLGRPPAHRDVPGRGVRSGVHLRRPVARDDSQAPPAGAARRGPRELCAAAGAAAHRGPAAAALARLLPPDVGIALNPGTGPSVPVYPEASPTWPVGRTWPARPDQRRAAPGPARRPARRHPLGPAAVPAASQAAAAWLSVRVRRRGPGHLGHARRPGRRRGPGRGDSRARAGRARPRRRIRVPDRRHVPRRGRARSGRRMGSARAVAVLPPRRPPV